MVGVGRLVVEKEEGEVEIAVPGGTGSAGEDVEGFWDFSLSPGTDEDKYAGKGGTGGTDEVEYEVSGRTDEVECEVAGRTDEVECEVAGRTDEDEYKVQAGNDAVEYEVSGRTDEDEYEVEGGAVSGAGGGIHCCAIFFSTSTTRSMTSKKIKPKAM